MNVDTGVQWAHWDGIKNFFDANEGHRQGVKTLRVRTSPTRWATFRDRLKALRVRTSPCVRREIAEFFSEFGPFGWSRCGEREGGELLTDFGLCGSSDGGVSSVVSCVGMSVAPVLSTDCSRAFSSTARGERRAWWRRLQCRHTVFLACGRPVGEFLSRFVLVSVQTSL